MKLSSVLPPKVKGVLRKAFKIAHRLLAPDFVRLHKYSADKRFLQLLAFAAIFDHEAAREWVRWALECRTKWLCKQGPLPLTNPEMKNLLVAVVREALAAQHLDRPIMLGLSSRFDARPLMVALWSIGIRPNLYTFGQIGNLDYDLARILDRRLDLGVVFIDTSEEDWSLELFEEVTSKTLDMPLSPRILVERTMARLHGPFLDVQGHLNRPLTGGTDPDTIEPGWDGARRTFARRNDWFSFQHVFPRRLVLSLLPEKPPSQDPGLSHYRQLDLGYRQRQRIRPTATSAQALALPYETERWVGHWLAASDFEKQGQRRWLGFVKTLDTKVFFDMASLTEETRQEIDAARIAKFYNACGRPISVSKTDPQKVLAPPHGHFSLFACYQNNQSFRKLVHEVIRRLDGRGVFDRSFTRSVFDNFVSGSWRGQQMLTGLLTVDVAIEVGRI